MLLLRRFASTTAISSRPAPFAATPAPIEVEWKHMTPKSKRIVAGTTIATTLVGGCISVSTGGPEAVLMTPLWAMWGYIAPTHFPMINLPETVATSVMEKYHRDETAVAGLWNQKRFELSQCSESDDFELMIKKSNTHPRTLGLECIDTLAILGQYAETYLETSEVAEWNNPRVNDIYKIHVDKEIFDIVNNARTRARAALDRLQDMTPMESVTIKTDK